MLNADERELLLKTALDSIRHGLAHGRPLPVDPNDYPEPLREPRATFVTLHDLDGGLRGCIGTLEPIRPLIADVAENGYAAAFRDPRFPELAERELRGLKLHISVLSLPEPIAFDSEADLLAKIRPGIDGLMLREGWNRGTFLPSVWEQLPDPHDFLTHLKYKAGLPASYWSPTVRVERYTTESFGAPESG